MKLVPDPGEFPISAVDGLQEALDSKIIANNIDGTAFSATFSGSGLPAKLWQNTKATAASPTDAEIGAQFTLHATGGLANKTTAYKIALTSSIVAEAGAADIYALNTIAHGYAGSGGYLITGIESDVNNIGADALTLASANSAYGFVAVCSGTKTSTAAYWATSVTQWQYGFAASNTAGSAISLATFYDETQSDNILLSHTAHDQGINLYAAAFSTGHAFIAPNNASFSAANAAGSGLPKNLIKLDGVDNVVIGYGLKAVQVAGEYLVPEQDNTAYLGFSGYRWKCIYAVNGVIQTSDLRDKTDLAPIDGALAMSVLRDVADDPNGLITFRWKVGGNDHRHAGWGAQVWEKALANHDLDIGLLVKDDPQDQDSKLSLRPDQAIPLLHAALIDADTRLEAALASIKHLMERITLLERSQA